MVEAGAGGDDGDDSYETGNDTLKLGLGISPCFSGVRGDDVAESGERRRNGNDLAFLMLCLLLSSS